jgi:phospholipase C
MGYYDDTDLPFYYGLARAFAISDMHFCALLGPTLPNRMFYFAGTSFGRIRNTPPPSEDADGVKFPNLFTRLNDAGVSWKVYSKGAPSPAMFILLFSDYQDRFVSYAEYLADAAAGRLPAVSVVEANYQPGQEIPRDDEHAPSNIQLGQKFTEEVVRALFASPQWPRSALFLTYDEHGGFHDHVPPPEACAPDDIPPERTPGDVEGDFTRYGFRVPLIAVSPYAKRGHVSHHVSDLTSVLRFVEARFDLRAMTRRDANAEPLYDLFDFSGADTSIPEIPAAEIDPGERERCQQAFPDQG